MKQLISRLTFGAIFALPLALLTFALAQASPPRSGGQADEPDCQSCHSSYQEAWQAGAHGNALNDPAFNEAWEKQGKPQECLACHTTGYDPATGTYTEAGVTCAQCHDPVPPDHPLAPATMSRSEELCGGCHRDTLFEWQNSKHGQSELTCVSCHDPHSTSIKTASVSEQCASCHGTRVAAFAHSEHAAQGLTCADCHITVDESAVGMGQGRHDHSFKVDLKTCNKCHETEIHNPQAAMLISGEATPAPPTSGNSAHPGTVSTQPNPVSPVGFAVFTGLIGMAVGIVLAPWLERGFRRFARAEKAVR
jgi:hypothetical protein